MRTYMRPFNDSYTQSNEIRENGYQGYHYPLHRGTKHVDVDRLNCE